MSWAGHCWHAKKWILRIRNVRGRSRCTLRGRKPLFKRLLNCCSNRLIKIMQRSTHYFLYCFNNEGLRVRRNRWSCLIILTGWWDRRIRYRAILTGASRIPIYWRVMKTKLAVRLKTLGTNMTKAFRTLIMSSFTMSLMKLL